MIQLILGHKDTCSLSYITFLQNDLLQMYMMKWVPT